MPVASLREREDPQPCIVMPRKYTEQELQAKLAETETEERALLAARAAAKKKRPRSTQSRNNAHVATKTLASLRSRLCRLRNAQKCRAREKAAAAARRRRLRKSASMTGEGTLTSGGHQPRDPFFASKCIHLSRRLRACLDSWDGSISSEFLHFR